MQNQDNLWDMYVGNTGEEKERGAETVLEIIRTQNCPKLMSDAKPNIVKMLRRTTGRIHAEKSFILRHSIFKLTENQ